MEPLPRVERGQDVEIGERWRDDYRMKLKRGCRENVYHIKRQKIIAIKLMIQALKSQNH